MVGQQLVSNHTHHVDVLSSISSKKKTFSLLCKTGPFLRFQGPGEIKIRPPLKNSNNLIHKVFNEYIYRKRTRDMYSTRSRHWGARCAQCSRLSAWPCGGGDGSSLTRVHMRSKICRAVRQCQEHRRSTLYPLADQIALEQGGGAQTNFFDITKMIARRKFFHIKIYNKPINN